LHLQNRRRTATTVLAVLWFMARLFFSTFSYRLCHSFYQDDDVKKVAVMALEKIALQPEQFSKNVSMIQLLESKSKSITEQIKIIKQAKKALMYQVLK
jgi:hypothetical protein